MILKVSTLYVRILQQLLKIKRYTYKGNKLYSNLVNLDNKG